MNLTPQQLGTLKTWLDANAVGLDDEQAAAALNQISSPDYLIWASNVNKQLIDGLIDKAVFTPTDNPPAAGNDTQATNNALLYNNRCLIAQLKQTNAQWQIIGPGNIDARQPGVRKIFQDCLRQLPTGASGNNQDAGWGAPANPGVVRLAMMRRVTVGEKLYVQTVANGNGNNSAEARGSNLNPDQCGIGENNALLEGPITAANVSNARQP